VCGTVDGDVGRAREITRTGKAASADEVAAGHPTAPTHDVAATAEVATATPNKVAAAPKMSTAGKVPAATATAVLGICQSGRAGDRHADQQRSDDSLEMPRFVHCLTLSLRPARSRCSLRA
jgi:hypothetical protein